MKKICYIGLLILLLSGCIEEFDRNPVTLNLQVNFNAQFGSSAVSSIPVTIKHQQKDVSLTTYTDANGQLTFKNLDPGFYTVSTSIRISSTQAEQLTNEYFNDSLVLNANKTISLLETSDDTLIIVPAFKSDLIIREFYYSGSRTNAGKLYVADQYLEIYNNSDKPYDIGGIIIAKHESVGYGYNMWAYIKDSVVVDMLWQIPEDSENHILQPGKGVVIARDAIDHKTDPNGNSNSPVDLSKADFEFYMTSDDNSDLDSPAENLKEIFTMERGSDITFFSRFGGGLMILQSETDDMDEYMIHHRIKKYSATGSTFKYVIVIPNTWVIDALDVLENKNSVMYKRFPESLDAGFTYNDESGTGTCITRKLISDVNGRRVYMDTNNSTYDFLNHQVPNPGLND